MQNYSFGIFSLVRGKEFWRLTSAASEEKHKASVLVAKLAALLKRLLQGEEAHPELFDIVHACASFLQTSPSLTEDQERSLESLTVLRMLHSLGYIGNEVQFGEYLKASDLDILLLDRVSVMCQLVNKHINTALRESHL